MSTAWDNYGGSAHSSYTAFVKDTTRLGFKAGTQASLNTLISNGHADEGVFYLTTDTHRLYVGRKNAAGGIVPVPVNEGITTVANQTALEALTGAQVNAGEFYYITDGNILAVAAGIDATSGKVKWLQLNKLSSLTATDNNITVVGATDAPVNGAADINVDVSDSLGNHSTGTATIIGGNNIQVAVDSSNNAITISTADQIDTTYEVKTASATGGAKIQLDATKANGTDGEDSEISILAGTSGNVTITNGTNNDSIIIDAKNSVVDGVSAGFAADGGFTIKVTNSDGIPTEVTSTAITPKISVGKSGMTAQPITNIVFADGVANLSGVYTAAQVDEKIAAKLQAADALTWQKVVKSATDLPNISEAQAGDVYKIGVENLSLSGKGIDSSFTGKLHIGDLLIATGTESESTGLITNGQYEVIPSANDAVIDGATVEHGMKITSTEPGGSGVETLAGFKLAIGSDDAALSFAADSVDDDGVNTVTLKHANVGAKSITATVPSVPSSFTPGASSGSGMWTNRAYTINTITALTTDKNGHVLTATNGSATIYDTHNRLTDLKTVVGAGTASNTIKIGFTPEDVDNTQYTSGSFGVFNVTSNNLTVAASGTDTVSIDLTWGTF